MQQGGLADLAWLSIKTPRYGYPGRFSAFANKRKDKVNVSARGIIVPQDLLLQIEDCE